MNQTHTQTRSMAKQRLEAAGLSPEHVRVAMREIGWAYGVGRSAGKRMIRLPAGVEPLTEEDVAELLGPFNPKKALRAR